MGNAPTGTVDALGIDSGRHLGFVVCLHVNSFVVLPPELLKMSFFSVTTRSHFLAG
jgi:hypothetical protein